MRETHVQKAFNFLMNNHYITHSIIHAETHCNDTYSVMEGVKLRLKKRCIPLYTMPMINEVTGNPYTHYFIEVA